MKVLLVDDELNARLALRGLIELYFPQLEILDEATNLPEAVRKINQLHPDLVFLDIEMPGYSGLELMNFFDVEKVNFKVVFVTAYSEFALQAFEMSAIDYLLKPVRKEQISRALEKLPETSTAQLQALHQNIQPNGERRIGLQLGDGLLFLKLEQIMYLRADGSYTHIHLTDGQRLTVTKKLLEYEKLEQWGHFQRIHRSHIINLQHISKILKQDGGVVVMSDGEQFAISIDKKQQLMAKFEDFRV